MTALPSQTARLILLAGLAILAHLPALVARTVWDDDFAGPFGTYSGLPGFRSDYPLWWIWFRPGMIQQYYPLVHTSYWLEYQLWGGRLLGYHATNMLLHAATSCLVFVALRRLRVPGAFIGACLFAVHPVGVESVAWLSERKNTLSGCFAAAAVAAWSAWRFPAPRLQAAADGNLRCYWLAVGCFAAAMLSKTVVITLVGVLPTIIWWKEGRIRRRDVVALLPFLGVGIPLALATVWLEKVVVGASGQEWSLLPVERLLVAGRAVTFYATKLLWPHPLVFFYPRWRIDAGAAWQWSFPAAVAAGLAASWAARGRIGRGPFAAAAIYAGMLFPALGFFDVFPFQYSFVADHFQYHASAAACAAAGAAIAGLPASIRPAVATLLVAVLGCLSFQQARHYFDAATLYRHVLRHNPASFPALLNLGIERMDANDLAEARPLFEAAGAAGLFPRQQTLARWNLVVACMRADDRRGALEAAAEAHALLPSRATRAMLGLSLVRIGRADEAARVLADTSHDVPDTTVGEKARLYEMLATAEVAAARGESQAARASLERLLVATENPWLRIDAAIAFAGLGDHARARQLFEPLTEVAGVRRIAMTNLAVLADLAGDREEAGRWRERAQAARP
jgi:tetratricopeptide (TPR) repeat protein